MKTIALTDYTIFIDEHFDALKKFIQENTYSAFNVLVDENTKVHCLPIIQTILPSANVIETRSGEQHKNINTCEEIWQQLIVFNTDRKALFINLGGGVIGDMGGFAASCYKRGIDFINIPTTLLSQVDSSIGGKLGIDFKYGKNLIGLFKNPKAVFIASSFFNTLPPRQFINGWAEIFKHALIQDKQQWEKYSTLNNLHTDINDIVYHSLLIKKHVVETDPYEKNWRKILNFGHTIGHAIEAYSLEYETDSLLHGEAIVIGMICEAYLSVKKCSLSEKKLETIQHKLLQHFPKKDISNFEIDKLMESMRIDKKNEGATILSALLEDIGTCKYDIPITESDVKESLQYYINL